MLSPKFLRFPSLSVNISLRTHDKIFESPTFNKKVEFRFS